MRSCGEASKKTTNGAAPAAALQDCSSARVPVVVDSPGISLGSYAYRRILESRSATPSPSGRSSPTRNHWQQAWVARFSLFRLVSVSPRSRVLMASMEVENHLDFEVLELFDRAIQDQVGYAERCLEALGEDLRSRGFRIRWEVRRSLPATEVAEIVGCAKREGVDLVLFSAPKSSRLSRLLFPSTAEQVARQLGVPVTLVVDHWKAGDRGGLSSAHAR